MAFSLRKARPDDACFVLSLFARPHVAEFAHGPPSVEVFVDVLRRGERELLVVERDGRAFGHAAFEVVDGWLLDLRVLAFEERRTGAGLFTLQWLLRHGFEELGLRRAFLEVRADNAGACALYERLGFRREGCYRDGYRAADGSFHDLIAYGMLAPEHRRASAAPSS